MKKSSLYLLTAFMLTFLLGLLLFNSIQLSDWNTQSSNEHKKEIVFAHWAYFPEEIFDKFNDEYPDLTVDYQHYNAAGYNDIIQQKMMMGETLDVIGVMGHELSQYVAQDWLLDLSGESLVQEYNPQVMDSLKQATGKVYTVAYKAEYFGIWYNKILFEKYNIDVPKTYRDFVSLCAVLKRNDINPIVLGARDEDVASYIYYLRIFGAIDSESELWSYQYGDSRFSDTVAATLFDDTQYLIDQGYISPDSVNLTYQQAFDYFKNAKAAMLIAPDASFNMARDDFEKVCDPGVFAIPYTNSSQQIKTPVDNRQMMIGISKNSDSTEEAGLLLDFLSRPDIVKLYCEQTVSYPTVLNVDTSYLKYNKLWEPIRSLPKQTAPFANLSTEEAASLDALAKEFIAGLINARQLANSFDVIICK